MGGPRNLNEVNGYLKGIFGDRDIMQLPMQDVLGPFIANRRTKKVQDEYEQIGGRSPIELWTKAQGSKMVKILDSISPSTGPHKYYIGFRYNEPNTNSAVKEMLQDGVTRAIAFSQYFQYSCSTTGSNLNELYRETKSLDSQGKIKWSVIDRWGTNADLVQVFANNIEKSLEKLDGSTKDTAPILFSAHSLPLYVVLRGDPYPAEVAATVGLVMQELRRRGVRNPYRLIWQSEVGPLKWLGPSTEHVIKTINKSSGGRIDSVVLVPIAFGSDHIETLYELGIEYRDLALSSGIKNYVLCPPPNDDDLLAKGMAELVKEHMENTGHLDNQIYMQCPGCESKQCRITKDWIASQASA
ncbi:Ferrochelatase, mitochondrial [Smittium mucronatum]|uniref:Ferrochelatase n=1 Tax=Smittium mucronatum TaxID=133383 RepID=A0A1R0H827_9FUNG|nr:Ferrochelatase, mitochondrial [Smittium mucronatum]